jgi:hypothetical protein
MSEVVRKGKVVNSAATPDEVIARPTIKDKRSPDGLGEAFAAPDGQPMWHKKGQDYGIEARDAVHGYKSTIAADFLNAFGSVLIALDNFASIDTVVGVVLAISCTIFYWFFNPGAAVNMSWNVVSMGIIFPITQNIVLGFKRREDGLVQFGHLLGNLRAVFGAMHTWKIKTGADAPWVRMVEALGETGAHDLQVLFDELLTALILYFETKRWKRARHQLAHRMNLGGLWKHPAQEEAELQTIAHEQSLRIDSCVSRVQRLVQHLKTKGLPGGEAHRLDQYVSKVRERERE